MKSTPASIVQPGRRRGQALIEVLVAVSVLTVGFLGIVTLLSRALSLNRVVADSYTATYLAAEGIEIAKNVMDGGGSCWNCGLRNGSYEIDSESFNMVVPFQEPGRKLGFDPSTKRYGYGYASPTAFTRKVTVLLVSDQEVQINSEVKWTTRGGGESTINLEDHFFNWKPSEEEA